ncbi:hypothetical protein HPULCUR_005112 [Helicostylum pulchrum]|uniref:OTU domain-containing protein n=1 Tax=Helicostylum pulchrum TaxID=562976 RepID=A0ABP9XY68_9FUNG
MGNRTSGRAESFHSDLKRASGSQFASRLALVFHRMNAYYDQKRADRYRKLEIERINFEDNDSNEITSNGTNAKYASDEDQNAIVSSENSDTINKDRLLLRVEKLLHDAIKALELAKSSIWALPIRMDELKPPYVNSNRKGRKAKQGVKSSTESLQINIDQKKRKLTLVETYRDPKTDAVFRWTGITPIDAIAAIHNVDADGNCGFRAISFDTYKD